MLANFIIIIFFCWPPLELCAVVRLTMRLGGFGGRGFPVGVWRAGMLARLWLTGRAAGFLAGGLPLIGGTSGHS